GILTNVATSGSGDCAPCELTNRAGTYTVVKTTPGRADGSTVKAGDVIDYAIIVTQSGPGAVTGATLTDDLSDVLDDATLTSGPSAGAAINDSNVLSWTGNLAVDQTVTIAYSVTVGAAGGNDQLSNQV